MAPHHSSRSTALRRTSSEAADAPLRWTALRLSLALLLALALSACGGADSPGGASTSAADAAGSTEVPDSAATPAAPAAGMVPIEDPVGMNAPATFRAVLPCADCPGILTTLAVEPDGSATLTRRYLEGEPGRDPAFVEEGRWRPDGAQTVEFAPRDGSEITRYLVYEGDLVMLDRDGSPPTTRSPRLPRLPQGPMTELAGTSWRFVDPAPAGGDAAVPSARFQPDGALTGTDGCNAFRSTWSVTGERALDIAALASTRMACPEGGGVVALRVVETLETAAGYRFDAEGEALVLLDGAGEPIARLRPTL